jgi:hypothetical protein
MKKFILWVRLNSLQTTNTYVYADNQLDAKLLGEDMYGVGNVLNYTEVSE